MSEYQRCPNCTHVTAMEGKNGKLRCIPCGFGLLPKSQWASPAKSAENARKMSGQR